jgi:hypothetical protein
MAADGIWVADDGAGSPYVLSNEEIAAQLFQPRMMLHTYLSCLLVILGAMGRNRLVVFAFETSITTV